MSDNFNINTTQAQSYASGGVDPNDPSQNVGDQIAMNQLKQQDQAQLVAQAVEKTKQAKIGTAESQDMFDTKAYLSEKGLMPKQQALAELKIILKKQKMEEAQIADITNEAEASWPEELDGSAIWRWFSALKDQKTGKIGEGEPFQVKEGEKDPQGTPVHAGFYQEILDSDGEKEWVRSGERASTKNQASKDDATIQKGKTDLVKSLTHELRAARGNWLSQGLYRCSVALQKLHETPFMTKQDLYQLAQDISAVFTGGVPTEDEILNSQYHTKLTEILSTLSSWTGHIMGLPLKDIREKLINVVQPLYDELINRFTNLMELIGQGHTDVLEADPQWWSDTKEKALHAAEHKQSVTMALPQGNMLPVGNANTSPTPAAGGAAPAPANGQQRKTQSGISYSVEG